MFDVEVVFVDGTSEIYKVTEWDLVDGVLKIKTDNHTWLYVPLSNIARWNSTRR